jgi:hypothetical protein
VSASSCETECVAVESPTDRANPRCVGGVTAKMPVGSGYLISDLPSTTVNTVYRLTSWRTIRPWLAPSARRTPISRWWDAALRAPGSRHSCRRPSATARPRPSPPRPTPETSDRPCRRRTSPVPRSPPRCDHRSAPEMSPGIAPREPSIPIVSAGPTHQGACGRRSARYARIRVSLDAGIERGLDIRVLVRAVSDGERL